MQVKKNDFVEIEFIGLANGEIFDTNIKKEAEKINLQIETKPLIVCIGQGMLVKGFDNALEDKELDKEYKIKPSPEEAFGARNKDLIKIIPLKVFKEKDINPAAGLVLNFDGLLARIVTVSGGRVITDFNNPLAGKEIEYIFKILRKITDEKEKINALQDFFFKKRFDFEIKDKKAIFKDEELKTPIEMFKERFKDILGLDFEVQEAKSKEERKENKKENTEKIKEEKVEKKSKEEKTKEKKKELKQNKEETQQKK